MRFLQLLFTLLLISQALFAAKIALFVLPLSNSHVIFTIRVAEELARDHDVVIIRPGANPKASKMISKHPRVTELRVKGASEQTWAAFEQTRDQIWGERGLSEFLETSGKYGKVIGEACADMVNDVDFIDRLRAERFDLAITHHLDACPIAVIHAAGIPQFGFVSSVPLIKSQLNHLGLPVFPSTLPSHLIDASNQMTFWQRMENFLIELMQSMIAAYFQPPSIDKLFRSKFGEDFPSVGQLIKKGTFLLANINPDIDFPVPVTSKVAYIGGLGMSNATEPLEEPYLSFIEKSEKIVFVSFGTVADPKSMPASWKRAFVEMFEQNPSVSFIWRMTDDVVVPPNVVRSMWHPQKDILGHAKVAAFITHGGYNSIGESLASGTPLIVVPLTGDQYRNSRLVEYRKFGVRISKADMTFEALNTALHKILDDPSFAQTTATLSRIVFSSPVSAGDTLRHTINFALENPHFDRNLPDLSLIEFFSLDMIFLLFILPVFIIVLLFPYVLFCCKRLFRKKEKMN